MERRMMLTRAPCRARKELFGYRTKVLGNTLRTTILPESERKRGKQHGGKAWMFRRLCRNMPCKFCLIRLTATLLKPE